jgi:hypothetical protein
LYHLCIILLHSSHLAVLPFHIAFVSSLFHNGGERLYAYAVLGIDRAEVSCRGLCLRRAPLFVCISISPAKKNNDLFN